MNEIEQDDEDNVMYCKNDYYDEEPCSVEGVNWLQEATEQQIQDDNNESNSNSQLENQINNDTNENIQTNNLSATSPTNEPSIEHQNESSN